MLQTFLLIDEFTKTRSRTLPAKFYNEQHTGGSLERLEGEEMPPETKLRSLGLRVIAPSQQRELLDWIRQADAVLLSVPADSLASWRQKVLALRPLPVFLWCDSLTFPSRECKLDIEVDGMISASMSAMDVHASLLLSFNHFMLRRQWQQEREQLLSRLEERKWIDQAKGILSEIKGISEAEAYDFLRKQAMNERKRMADVASSIVKVYQLLQDHSKGGRRG